MKVLLWYIGMIMIVVIVDVVNVIVVIIINNNNNSFLKCKNMRVSLSIHTSRLPKAHLTRSCNPHPTFHSSISNFVTNDHHVFISTSSQLLDPLIPTPGACWSTPGCLRPGRCHLESAPMWSSFCGATGSNPTDHLALPISLPLWLSCTIAWSTPWPWGFLKKKHRNHGALTIIQIFDQQCLACFRLRELRSRSLQSGLLFLPTHHQAPGPTGWFHPSNFI